MKPWLGQWRRRCSLFAATFLATSASYAAFGDEQALWVGGWGINASGGKKIPIIEPFIASGADNVLLPEYRNLPGRTLYVLNADGTRGSGQVARLDEEPGACIADVVLSAWSQMDANQFFLGSTSPIKAASYSGLPVTDTRLTEGIVRYLRGKGMDKPQAQIARVIEADLDGDGRRESIVEAHTIRRDLLADSDNNLIINEEQPSDFSIVAIGYLTDTSYEVEDHAGYIFDVGARSAFQFVGLPDYTGTGRFDLAVSYYGSEWAGVAVYAWSGKRLSLIANADCGL